MNPKIWKSCWSLGIHASTGLARWFDGVVVPGNNVFQPRWVPVHAAQPSHGLSQWYQSPGDQRWKSIKIGSGVGGSPHLSRECWVRKPRKKSGQKIIVFLVHSALEKKDRTTELGERSVQPPTVLVGGGVFNFPKCYIPPSFCNSHVYTDMVYSLQNWFLSRENNFFIICSSLID